MAALGSEDWEREIFENQQEITTPTVIWARPLVSPQPKAEAGAGPVAERVAGAGECTEVGAKCLAALAGVA